MSTRVPTLIIGLGGIGSEIVEQIEIRTQNRKNTFFGKYVRDNIQFVIMDTDENSIRERRQNGYKGYSVTLSGDVSVGKCLEWDEDARTNWFPKDNIFKNKSIAEGAGQVRAVSRLAFQRAIRVGALEPLHKAIGALFKQSINNTNQELKIILVSTIAGGTGSGVFLPLGMYLKEYMKNTYSGSGVKIDTCLILPEVLESLKSSRNEKNNLLSNGYAALKEVSYFMHRTDNNIDDDDVYIKLPSDDGNGLTIYKESPFDFCFLFGKLTEKKKEFENLEAYKRAVEQCIYTQFIGSYSGRFFSIEDNMLVVNINDVKQDLKQEGRQIVLARFASASCFKVYYPYREIAEYLALSWGVDIMAKEWLKYDEEVRAFNYMQRKNRESGIGGIEQTDAEAFVGAVKRIAEKEDYYAKEIIANEAEQKNAEKFVVQLEKYINASVEEEMDLWEEIRDEKTYIDNRKYKMSSLREFFNYYSKIEKSITIIREKVTTNIEYELMKLHENEEEWKDVFLEFYLKKEKREEWKSPNEIRYILSEIVVQLTEKYENRVKELDNAKAELSRYIKREIDIEKSDAVIKERKFIAGWLDKRKVEKQISEVYEQILVSSEKVLRSEVCAYCYSKMKLYVEGLLKNYQIYFDEYENTKYYYERRIQELGERFDYTVQGIEWLVCVSRECTTEMLKRMQQKKIYYQIGGEVSEWIYKYCSKRGNENRMHKYEKNQEEVMKEMWADMFARNYQEEFDINLFDAFSKEAEYMGKSENIELYIIQQLERAEKEFSVPLLTACRKDLGRNSAWCIYSPVLARGMSYSTVKSHYFKNAKAICDNEELDTDKQSIIFYQNRYGLESFMVDFANSDSGKDNNFPIGGGYKAYQNMINRIAGYNARVTLTPHIDNSWHNREIMRDMDREMQIEYIKWAVKVIWLKKQLTTNSSEVPKFDKSTIEKCIWNMVSIKEEYKKHISDIQNNGQEIKLENDMQEYKKSLKNQDYEEIVLEAIKRAEEEIKKDVG